MENKYVVCKSDIDGLCRVMLEKDAPYGVCFSTGETYEEAIQDGADFLGISADEIEVY